MNKRHPMIGDVFVMEFNGRGNAQRGKRPGVIFQNNKGNKHSPNIVALPMTTSLKKQNMPTHVVLRAEDTGLSRDSMVLCENPECISKDSIGEYLTTLTPEQMEKIAIASLLASSAISFVNIEVLPEVFQQAVTLNSTQ